MTSILRRWQTEEGDTYVVSLVRAILGVLLLLSGLRESRILRGDAFFEDVFHIPVIPEAFIPGRTLFSALTVAQLVLALLMVVGWFARPSMIATALVGFYLLLCDRLAYHNNRYALFLFSLVLAFSPCDRAFVWRRPAKTAAERKGPLWAARLAQMQMSIIYLASGGSKLLDSDWREGLVIGDRLARATPLAVAKGVPASLLEALAHPTFASALAKVAILTELFLAVGLFLPRTRSFALWWGVMFHLTIEVTSQVELFTWLSLAMYALFAVPTLRERAIVYDPAQQWGGWVARVVERFDWLARFEVRADGAATAGQRWTVVDRDGTRAAGLLGMARIARATPLFFPLFLPLRALALVFSRPAQQ
jgi:vitamin K-dependent gamma-carboxylase-like protein